MAHALLTPRVNNNDDTVRLSRLFVKVGDALQAGDCVAEVETDKANFTVEADRPGFVLSVVPQPDAMIDVGSVLMWIGATPDEPLQEAQVPAPTAATRTISAPPTLKAAQLLAQHGLSPELVPASGERLTVADVEAFLRARDTAPAPAPTTTPHPGNNGHGPLPSSAPDGGTLEPLTPEERGVLRTVLWQRQEAVPCYVEVPFDAAAWDALAREYQQREKLLMSPLLALLAYRLVKHARDNRRLNATLVDNQRFAYDTVNLGFTVQSGPTLFLAVVRDAASLTCRQFVDRLASLQKKAMGNRLDASETSGASVAFSSMARWSVTRHVPALAPRTSFMLAHAAPAPSGDAVLGATYDHRLLTGFDAVSALAAISTPEIPE
jgi:pyruvate/2-oxoglutarate dehydrogenase complex dihydrolipoamide acyltransferase (E2) component